MSYNKNLPYNSLPELPPKADLETRSVLKLVVKAASALAQLRGVTSQIPNPAILIRAIGLEEAKASSEIENIVTTSDELYKALSDSIDAASPATKEVLRYRDAILAGLQTLEQRPLITTNLFCTVTSTIKQQEMGVRKLPGTKLMTSAGETIYTPPEGESIIRSKLADLEKFINEKSDLDPLIKLAILHYQFEAIHPFSDGNGRCGRIINILYLILENFLDIPVLYLSKFLIDHKTDYYVHLLNVTEEGNWIAWITFMLQAIEQTAIATTTKILAIRNLMTETQLLVKERLPKVYSWELIELLFSWPYCKIRFLEERNVAKRQTAATYLRSLEEIGLLHSLKSGRENYFINHKLLTLLKE